VKPANSRSHIEAERVGELHKINDRNPVLAGLDSTDVRLRGTLPKGVPESHVVPVAQAFVGRPLLGCQAPPVRRFSNEGVDDKPMGKAVTRSSHGRDRPY
jgi:hypothetical protein